MQVYYPFGYGAPLVPLGLLFLLFPGELGTDPKVFLAYDPVIKTWFFFYLTLVTSSGTPVFFPLYVILLLKGLPRSKGPLP